MLFYISTSTNLSATRVVFRGIRVPVKGNDKIVNMRRHALLVLDRNPSRVCLPQTLFGTFGRSDVTFGYILEQIFNREFAAVFSNEFQKGWLSNRGLLAFIKHDRFELLSSFCNKSNRRLSLISTQLIAYTPPSCLANISSIIFEAIPSFCAYDMGSDVKYQKQ